MGNLYNRIYSDFLLPSRIVEYEHILEEGLNAGYSFLTMHQFYMRFVKSNSPESEGKFFINRHDIDTDIRTARMIFNSEVKAGIKSTFYFRLKTVDYALMKDIHSYGSEVGYHFEEIADFCKSNRTLNSESVFNSFREIKETFLKNLSSLESNSGFKFKSIASHGDFVNRKINIPNHRFIDSDLLKKAGLDFECYDTNIFEKIESYCSDAPYPIFYRGNTSPIQAIHNQSKTIVFLTHPRHWNSSPIENLLDNIGRLFEGIRLQNR